MSLKHLFNSPDGLVLNSLRGAVALNPALRLHDQSKSVYAVPSSAPVIVISGGGAGHEPAHASYTGRGMLAASVSGDIFASPSTSQILTAIRLAVEVSSSPDRSVLLIVNNYTGDRLNFGLAAEKAQALGINVETVVVADDVSLLDKASLVGPRGLGGNILVCKIIGAAAERRDRLSDLKRLGDVVTANLASIGVGLEHCHVPGRSKATAEGALSDAECELGMGLHNEPGAKKIRTDSCESLIKEMIEQILTSSKRRGQSDASFIRTGDENVDCVVLFINNLGGMSQLEMGAILTEVLNQLEKLHIYPARIYLSSYMTSLNAPGFSISLLNLTSIHCQIGPSSAYDPSDVLSLLDAPTDALAWIGVRTHWPHLDSRRNRTQEESETEKLVQSFVPKSSSSAQLSSKTAHNSASDEWKELGLSPEDVSRSMRTACFSVLSSEQQMTEFDTIVGDGDCGETFASGAKAVLAALESGDMDVSKLFGSELISKTATILENSMGGTSGALFGLYLTAFSNSLHSTLSSSSSSHSIWCSAASQALTALSKHTPAQPGDRTLVDALHPFCSALSSNQSFAAAAQAARKGAESTRIMRPRLGRATYVGADGENAGNLPPDPGAWGVAVIVEGLADGLVG